MHIQIVLDVQCKATESALSDKLTPDTTATTTRLSDLTWS